MRKIIAVLFVLFAVNLLNAYTISGYTNITDTPAEGVVLELYSQHPGMSTYPIDSTTSDEVGFYFFDIASPGMYYVGALIETPVYQYLFYENVASPQLAITIHLSNISPIQENINFNFQPNIPAGDNAISGTVTDNATNPAENVQVALYPAQHSCAWMAVFSTETDENGNYALEELPDGDYLLRAWNPLYHSYFYNGVPAWPMAEIISLANSMIVSIDISLEPKITYTVSGYVEDAQTGSPLAGAEIYGIPQFGHYSQSNSQSGMILSTETDADGMYSLVLPENTYMIMAIDPESKNVMFYDNVYTPLSATWMTLDQNIGEVDFLMNEIPAGDYALSGTITVGGGNPLEPVPLLAVAVSSDEDWEETVAVESTGDYIFPDLPAGNYYIYAFSPLSIPTYFADAISFEEADLIELQSNLTGIDIDLQSAQEDGYLDCSGFVLDETAAAVANATVAFLDPLGNIYDFAITDDAGEYSVPALASLNYTAIATKTFYSSDEVQLAFNGNLSWNFTLDATCTDNDQALPDTPQSLQIRVYPNPFNPQTNLSFSLPESTDSAEIAIFNLRGQKVYTQTISEPRAGTNSLAWTAKDNNGKTIGSGVYLLKISAGKYLGTGKLLLLK